MSSKHGLQRGIQAVASQVYVTSLRIGIDWNGSAVFLDRYPARSTNFEIDANATMAFEIWVAQAHFERVGW